MKVEFSLLLLLLVVGFSNSWMTPLTNINFPPQQRRMYRTTATATARYAYITPPQSLTMIDKRDAIGTKKTISTSIEIENEESSITVTTPASDPRLGALIISTALVGLGAVVLSPEPASAVVTITTAAAASSTIITAGGAVSSALFAYGHYFSIIGIVGILVTERWTLENGPNLTEDEENRLAIADTLYGAIGLLVVYTGYYRLSDPTLGKGTYFYVHEPVFWLKMAMVSILGGASLFNTTKIIQRSVARFTGDKAAEPMSEALCDRMKSICNAQLTGIVFIPMAATFMARGVGYNESIPWQLEAGGTALLFLGLGFKYVREALTFEARLLENEKENSNTMVS